MPGYKQTEVGVIPEDWEIHTIGDSMRLVNGRAFKPADWKKQGLPIIRIQNLNDSASPFNYYSGQVEDRHRIEKEDILFAWSGTTGTSFGARIWGGPTGVLNQHIFKVLPDAKRFTPRYAFLILLRVQEEIEKRAHGFKASFVHVKKSELVGVQLPLPPTRAEQEAIAEALSDANALIESLEQLIAKKRHLKQGAMQELLTGKKRLPGFNGDWESKSFKDILLRVNSKEHQILTRDYQAIGNYPVVDQGKEPVIGYSDRDDKLFRCPEGGVIVFGDHTCIVKFVGFDFVVGADGTQILAAKAGQSARFHALQLQHSGIPPTGYNRHFKFLKERTFLAPLLAEQAAVAAILSDMDAEIAALEAKLAKAGSSSRA